MEEVMSKNEILELLKELAKPIDFEKLIANGVLRKTGEWYEVLKPEKLPDYAWKQANAAGQTEKGKMRIQFQDTSKTAKALYKKISGKSLQES